MRFCLRTRRPATAACGLVSALLDVLCTMQTLHWHHSPPELYSQFELLLANRPELVEALSSIYTLELCSGK